MIVLNKENSEMLGHMPVKKLLIKLAIPAIAAMAINALYNFVDALFVAWAPDGIRAVGALGIAYPVQMIILGIGIMIGIGSASVFSRAFGRGDEAAMKRAVNTALLLNLILSASISIGSLIFMEPLLTLFGANSENVAYAREYLQIILIALIPFSLSITFNNLTRAEGRPKIAMISLMIGAGLNIILDPLFIFDWGLGLGVTGAAWATAIGKTASFLFVFLMALSPKSSLMIDLKHFYRIDFGMMKEIIAVGLPSFVRTALGGVLIVIVNNLINKYAPGGDEGAAVYISIYSVINRLLRFSLMAGFGLVQGMIPIVGFNYGARYFQRLYDVIAYTSKLLLIYFGIVFLIVMIGARYLFMIFGDPDAVPITNAVDFIEDGAMAFRIVSLGFIFITFQVILSSTYQAMGYPLRAFIVAVSRRFVFFLPFAFLLTWLVGINGIWWTFFVADLITGLGSYIVYRLEMKELKQRIASS